ncbi:MAG: hypothetical protein BGO89_08270 [Candidatus Kapaibacterium thiocyanatum]|uniref:HTH cro/C1-type domain-containing protein n=1 Tax=Candidatus Kapaibacterium thiocyanatum TaxID=1895771 RepID=A0A1M3L3P6_9BACT|nr:MAG: hypothetical protein BGO89_08270 ['Candidatus Kapabacteria' thiocyanatum]
MDVGSTMKKLRELHGLSQTELARRLEITQSHLSLVEKGDRTLHQSVLERASVVFGMPLSVFVFLSMTEDEVAPEKREYFRQTQPQINAFLREIFPLKTETNRE